MFQLNSQISDRKRSISVVAYYCQIELMPPCYIRDSLVQFLSFVHPDVWAEGLVNILIVHDPSPLNVLGIPHCLWLSYVFLVLVLLNVADSTEL